MKKKNTKKNTINESNLKERESNKKDLRKKFEPRYSTVDIRRLAMTYWSIISPDGETLEYYQRGFDPPLPTDFKQYYCRNCRVTYMLAGWTEQYCFCEWCGARLNPQVRLF